MGVPSFPVKYRVAIPRLVCFVKYCLTHPPFRGEARNNLRITGENVENFKKITKQQSPARTIAFGFAVLIFIGAALLSLPIAVRGAVQLPGLDALFTATSAVCVTGLVTVDPGDTFTLFGQAVLAVLMQLGGLGISSVSMGLAIAAGRRISFRGRSLVREALNVESFGGMVKLVRSIMAMTLLVEGIGAVASYPVFARDYSPLHAAWMQRVPRDRFL